MVEFSARLHAVDKRVTLYLIFQTRLYYLSVTVFLPYPMIIFYQAIMLKSILLANILHFHFIKLMQHIHYTS